MPFLGFFVLRRYDEVINNLSSNSIWLRLLLVMFLAPKEYKPVFPTSKAVFQALCCYLQNLILKFSRAQYLQMKHWHFFNDLFELLYPCQVEHSTSTRDGRRRSNVFDKDFIVTDFITYLHDSCGIFSIFFILQASFVNLWLVPPSVLVGWKSILNLNSLGIFRGQKLMVLIHIGIVATHAKSLKWRALFATHICADYLI